MILLIALILPVITSVLSSALLLAVIVYDVRRNR